MWFDTIKLGRFIVEFPNLDVLLSLKIVFNLANSADPDEILHHLLGFHCLQKYLLRGFQYTNGLNGPPPKRSVFWFKTR